MTDHASRPRRQGVSSQYLAGSWSVFWAEIKRLPDLLVELLHKISSDLNKSRRELFFDGTDWL
jgi:hypothetical protein